MRIAIIGAGIAGNTAGYMLHREHDITLFEASSRIGGHTHTVVVEEPGQTLQIDTGFIVFNEPNYPNFVELLRELGVPSQATTMSFSVRCMQTGLEYNGGGVNRLFSQRRNLLRPRFHRMIYDILRFGREAPVWLGEGGDDSSVSE